MLYTMLKNSCTYFVRLANECRKPDAQKLLQEPGVGDAGRLHHEQHVLQPALQGDAESPEEGGVVVRGGRRQRRRWRQTPQALLCREDQQYDRDQTDGGRRNGVAHR